MPRTDVASRVINVSPDDVFGALVDRAALETWLPPGRMTGRFERFDARPGGSYRMVLTHPDSATGQGKTTDLSDVVEVRFVDLVEGVRIVQEVDFISDDPAFGGTMTMTWDIGPAGDGTSVKVTAENVPDGVSAEGHVTGMTATLGQLAHYLGG